MLGTNKVVVVVVVVVTGNHTGPVTTKSLGVFVDENLDWNTHIETVRKSLQL